MVIRAFREFEHLTIHRRAREKMSRLFVPRWRLKVLTKKKRWCRQFLRLSFFCPKLDLRDFIRAADNFSWSHRILSWSLQCLVRQYVQPLTPTATALLHWLLSPRPK